MNHKVIAIVFGNLAAKGIAIIREALFAAWFGTGDIAAAFRIANTGFLMPIHAFIGDTLSAGVLPLYRQLKERNQNEPRILAIIAACYGLAFSSVVTPLVFCYSDYVTAKIAPGASPSTLALASSLLKILAFATPFYVLSGTIAYIEAAYGYYSAIAWRPMLLNLGSIGGAVLAVWFHQELWLAIGVLGSHIALLTWAVSELRKLDKLLPDIRPERSLVFTIGKRFLWNTAPLIGLPIISQSTVLVEKIVSSWLGTHVIPSVDYARFISDMAVQTVAVPLGILTMSMHGGADSKEARTHVRVVAASVMLLAFPFATFIGQNAEGIVRLLFARGAFDAESVALTTSILRWMGGSIGATVTSYYLVKALNSQLRNRDALVFTTIAGVGNILANLILWRHLGPPALGAAAALQSVLLMVLCILRLGILSELLPVAGGLFIGCTCEVLACSTLTAGLKYPLDVIANGAITTCIWLSLIAYLPSLRIAAEPILSHIPARFRNRSKAVE